MRRFPKQINPGRLLVFYYLTIIIIGAFFLLLPISSKNLSPIDALFTSTSAVCVTGLVVRDVATDFTFLGKIIILILIQIGGIGYMTLSTAFFFFLGQKISLRDRLLVKEQFNFFSYENLRRFAFTVLRVTVTIEGIGAFLLFCYFYFKSQMSLSLAIGHAIFHSVSAFCNAGFSTFSDNLGNFPQNYFVPIVMSLLIISGGIGFIVISDIYKRYITHKNRQVSLHTKTVLTTTGLLIFIGTLLILFLEWPGAFNGLPIGYKLLNAYFYAVTPRTAGFSTLSVAGFRLATQLLIMILMFIGASSGGTGGGVKTTTFSILLLELRALLTGQQELLIYNRKVSQAQTFKAFLIIGLAITYLLISLFLLLIFNHANINFITNAFELISAFGTVGLSLGSKIMPQLSASYDFTIIGKIIIILTMLVGRVGILTVSTALIRKRLIRYTQPEGVILIG
ncbi:MAG: TrkH family potassium uptake protein [candidate division WOR-3 bacterium]